MGEAIKQRLEYAASIKVDPEAAAAAAAAALVEVDEDGDGIPDMAVPLVFTTGAGSMPGGSHEEKLGVYLPQVGTENERPFYAHESNPGLRMWWAKGRWWLGKRDEQGRNRGWLKVKDDSFQPPKCGWIVYATKEKAWRDATDLTCIDAERIAVGGESPGNVHGEKLGEFCRTTDTVNERPVYCREAR